MPLWRSTTLILLLVVTAGAQEPRQKADQSKPLSPREELGTFRLDPKFTIELVAAEPEVVDPVAFCFDAKGDLYVVEMRGYPNGGVGDGKPNFPGRIKKLQDRDGDGYYETATVFLDNLRFPCAITPWRNGFLIGDAPDLFFAADTDGDGRADVRKVLYTGFGTKNIQQMINSLQFHFDNWVYGCNGGNDSPVRSVEKADAPVVQLRGMHFRFKPDVPGSLEPCSGGGQYGLTVNENGDWFTCTNSQHIRHIVLPDHYLKRNPYLAVPSVTLDIADHDAACKVFRISPFEQWRLERTTRRAGSEDAKRFPSTELVPGGYVTSGCSSCVYLPGRAIEKEGPGYHGHVFVCDPANNLIHRDVLVPAGSTYRAERHDRDCEFLASTDAWFRPVFLYNGPGGALYVADFYREIIETPLSLPDDIKARWNLNSRERGRIWRIRSKTSESQERLSLDTRSTRKLAVLATRGDNPAWEANTAHRLVVERPTDPEAVEEMLLLATQPTLPSAHVNNLWLLHAWGQLKPEHLEVAFESTYPSVIIQALQLAERPGLLSAAAKARILRFVTEPNVHIRFQLALSLGSLPLTPEEKTKAIDSMARRSDCDLWQQTALLSSVRGIEVETLRRVAANPNVPIEFVERLAGIVGKALTPQALSTEPSLRDLVAGKWTARQVAILRGLGPIFVQSQPGLVDRVVEYLKATSDESLRIQIISLLALVSYEKAEPILKSSLQPQQAPALQQAALRAMSAYADRRIPALIFDNWPGWGPQVRREAQEVLFSRTMYLERLLEAAQQGTFPLRQLDSTRRDQLLKLANPKLRESAKRLIAAQAASTRGEIVKKYQPALSFTPDVNHGKAVFTKHCSTCHQFDGQGHAVGPDLHSALGNKTKEVLLIDLLDPNREVDSRYVNYVITTKQGRTLTGMIASESAGSVTLRRAEGVEETSLRSDIDEVQGSGKSLMPENFEEQLSPQDVADLLGYLLAARSRK